MDKELIFEKGVFYERTRRQVYLHKTIGWSCIVFAILFFFFSVSSFPSKAYISLALFVFGACSVYLGLKEQTKLGWLKR